MQTFVAGESEAGTAAVVAVIEGFPGNALAAEYGSGKCESHQFALQYLLIMWLASNDIITTLRFRSTIESSCE